MKKIAIISCATVLAVNSFGFDLGGLVKSAAPVAAQMVGQSDTVQNNTLVKSLGSLGVTPTQAAGGAAVLLNSAKGKMNPSDFSSLTQQTPGLTDILGNYALNSIVGGSSVGSQFKALGMEPSMVGQFVPIIVNYAKGFATPDVISSLSSALSF